MHLPKIDESKYICNNSENVGESFNRNIQKLKQKNNNLPHSGFELLANAQIKNGKFWSGNVEFYK